MPVETYPDHYRIDGRAYDRVTKILEFVPSPELEAWRLRVGESEAGKKMRAQGRIGDSVHKYIAAHLLDQKLPKPTAKTKPYLTAYQKWQVKASLEEMQVVAVEHTVWDEWEGWAGTLDLAARTKWGNYIIDFKTSRTIWPSYFYQLHAYLHAFNGTLTWAKKDWAFNKIKVVRLDADMEDYEEAEMVWDQEIYDGFLHWVEAYKIHMRYFYPNEWERIHGGEKNE